MEQKQNILLLMMPFWPPLIPPMGMACLKSFLGSHGYHVTTLDANVVAEFRNTYDSYCEILKENVPPEKQGNFYNISIDVLQNHLTSHFNQRQNDGVDGLPEEEYRELIKTIVYKNYFTPVSEEVIDKMDNVIKELYSRLHQWLMQLLEEKKPDVLGLSLYKGTFGASLFAFKKTKERCPHIMTVMGGGIFSDQLAINSPNYLYFLEKTPYIDKVIVGEGESLFLRLLEGELPADRKVFTQQDNGGQLLDITTAPTPDFSDFDTSFYPQMASYTSRSCPFQCGFCSETVNWGRYRKKKAPHIVEELHQLHQLHRSQLFLMSDSLLNPVIDSLAEEMLQSDVSLYWDGYLRADKPVCDPENTIKWRRGGFYRARLGIESGSPNVLKLMDKRITPQQIKDALASLASAGIKTTTYWVIGYPGETESDFRETLDLIEEVKDYLYEAECNPFRFYLSGQVQSENWVRSDKNSLLFPADAADLLVIRTWVMEERTPRPEIYSRVSRFVAHCRKLGIPNPYSWSDIHKADDRWTKLHVNAVPPLMEFKDSGIYIDECKTIQPLTRAAIIPEEEGDFDFM
ncbi:MAG: radical SAM protein [bacterium]|nr:radical SAM protein [bacterium]